MIEKTIVVLRGPRWFAVAGAAALLLIALTAAGVGRGTAARRAAGIHSGAAKELLGMTLTPAPNAQAAAAANAAQVTISSFSFGPATLTVPAGTTVTWTNQDSVTHTVTASERSFDSSNLRPGEQFSYTFTAPGTYSYHCSIHPFMMGQVVVQ